MLRSEVEFRTLLQKTRVKELREKLSRFELDPDKENRRDRYHCKACWYLDSKIAGQAFTETSCMECGVRMTFSTTRTDRYCPDCAEKHKVCAHCGGRID
jgi:hypothetical protein